MTETVLLKKGASALLTDAHTAAGVSAATHAVGVPDVVPPMLAAWRAAFGGLWVGGTVTLTTERIRFTPKTGDLEVEVLLRELVDVQVTPGALKKVISLSTEAVMCKVRCFGARELADAVLAAQKDAVSRGAAATGDNGDKRASEGAGTPSPQPRSARADVAAMLADLNHLHDAGALSDVEFAAAKAQMLRIDD